MLTSLKDSDAVYLLKDQLLSGKLGDGTFMPEYSERSVKVFNKKPGPWTLFDKGDYQGGIFMDASKFPVLFDSTDSKTGMIAQKIESNGSDADEILRLNKTNIDKVGGKVKEETKKFVREIIQLR